MGLRDLLKLKKKLPITRPRVYPERAVNDLIRFFDQTGHVVRAYIGERSEAEEGTSAVYVIGVVISEKKPALMEDLLPRMLDVVKPALAGRASADIRDVTHLIPGDPVGAYLVKETRPFYNKA